MPPRVAEQLDLSSEQREQVAKLEAEVKAKMEKILSPDQLEQMKQMRPPLPEGGPARIGGAGGPPARMRGAGAPMDQMRGPGSQGRMGGQRFMMPIIEALDLNKDGIIQAEELARASKSLATLDKNEDGKLTPDELRPPRLGGPGGSKVLAAMLGALVPVGWAARAASAFRSGHRRNSDLSRHAA